MMITIHGLPATIKYQDLKVIIKQECKIADFILDNLVYDSEGLKKVRVGLADDSEGNHVIKCLNGYHLSGHVLQVTPVGKSGGFQNQNDYRTEQPRMEPWNSQPQWTPNPIVQTQQNSFSYQQGQQMSNYGHSGVTQVRPQFDQRASILSRIGPPSQGFSIAPKNAPAPSLPSVRQGVLRTVEIIDTPRIVQQSRHPGTDYDTLRDRPVTIVKDNFQGSQYSAQQSSGHYHERDSWNQQKPQPFGKTSDRMSYDDNRPPQDKRALLKEPLKHMQGAKEMHKPQFSQERVQDISSQGRGLDPSRRNMIPGVYTSSSSRRFSPSGRLPSPTGRTGRSISPSGRHISIPGRGMSPSGRRMSPSGRRMSPSGRRMSPSGRRMSPSGRRMSPPGRRMSPSGRRMSPSGRRMSPPARRMSPSGRRMSPSGRRMSPSGRHMSPSGRRISPSGRRMSPSGRPLSPSERRMSPSGRRMSPSGRRISPSGRRMSPSGRRLSPSVKRLSPSGRRISPSARGISPSERFMSTTGRPIPPSGRPIPSSGRPIPPPGRPIPPSGRPISPSARGVPHGRHISPPTRKEPLISRNIPVRREGIREVSPGKRIQSGQERYSPTRHFQEDLRPAKQVRPAYEPPSAPNQAMYSGGYRPNENVQYPLQSREERPDRWSNREKELGKNHDDERRDMIRISKLDQSRPLEHTRGIGEEMKRSRSVNRESRSPRRDRSPLRDRYKRHSPSPRSPRRSWALEKRRSPEDPEAPPPPSWPGQDPNRMKDFRDKRQPYPERMEETRVPTWDMNKFEPKPEERRDVRPILDDRGPFERGSIAVRKDIEKWKPIGNDNQKQTPPRYNPEENERALRRKEIDVRPQDFRMQDDDRKMRSDRQEFSEYFREHERPYKSDYTDTSDFSKIKEELSRRIEKKTEILKKQEELQKEIEDVYQRAVDFTKKAQMYKKGDQRREGNHRDDRRHDAQDPKDFDLPTLSRFKEDRRSDVRKPYERDDMPHKSREPIPKPHREERRPEDPKTASPTNKSRKEKATEAIAEKILNKFGGLLPKDIAFRVKEELKYAVSKIFKGMFGDEDVSFIELIIKFNSKHSTKDEEKIYDEVLSSLPSQYRKLKRPAKDEPSEIPSKSSKASPIPNTMTKDESQPESYQIPSWDYSFASHQMPQMPHDAFMAAQYMVPVPTTFMPAYPEVPQHMQQAMFEPENEGYNLYLCKDDFQPIKGHEADILKDYLIQNIIQVTQNSQGWSPDFTLKGLQSPFRYEVVTQDEVSRDWLLNLDFSELTDFSVLVYTKEELWYERAAVWLPGHSKCRNVEPLQKLKLQNKFLESINIGKWKLVKKIVTSKGTRVYVDMPPSSARALENHKMMLSFELQKVNVFLKAVAVDKDAFDAGLKEPSIQNLPAPQYITMPSLPHEPNAVKFCFKGDKPVPLAVARKIKDSIIYQLFKYHQMGGTSRTDFTKYGFIRPGYFGVLPENHESRRWIMSLHLGAVNKQPIIVMGSDDYETRHIKMFIILPGEQTATLPLVMERLRNGNQGVKGLNFHKWRRPKLTYDMYSRKSTLEVEMDLESVETIVRMKYQLDYVSDGEEIFALVKSEYVNSRLEAIIQKYKEELSDTYDVANMDLASGSDQSDDDVVCLD